MNTEDATFRRLQQKITFDELNTLIVDNLRSYSLHSDKTADEFCKSYGWALEDFVAEHNKRMARVSEIRNSWCKLSDRIFPKGQE